MDTVAFAAAPHRETPPDTGAAEDRRLLDRYSAQMVIDQLPWRTRVLRSDSAAQFLQWWRTLYTGEAYDLYGTARRWPKDESAWPYLRECYLRFACEDRDLRHEERSCLNHFLRFIEAGTRRQTDAVQPTGPVVRPQPARG
jgi:hypothetical protein